MNEFKLIVAGGRDFQDYNRLELVILALSSYALADKDISIVTGMAKGADRLAYQFAKQNKVVCYEYPADWEKHGKSAGYIRNIEMGKASDGLLAFWDGASRGTKHMIDTMTKMGKWVHVIQY